MKGGHRILHRDHLMAPTKNSYIGSMSFWLAIKIDVDHLTTNLI